MGAARWLDRASGKARPANVHDVRLLRAQKRDTAVLLRYDVAHTHTHAHNTQLPPSRTRSGLAARRWLYNLVRTVQSNTTSHKHTHARTHNDHDHKPTTTTTLPPSRSRSALARASASSAAQALQLREG
eukprot:scaffold4210_cov122-Isochrysis_galbana.AAC.5